MSITYPLTWPTGILPNRVRWKPRTVVAVSESPFTLIQQVYAWPGQAWAAELDFPKLTRAEGSAFLAFLLSLNGREGTFTFGDPVATSPRGTALGTPKVDGASQTGAELDTKGWTINQTGVLLAGDFIQLGSGFTARLYRVLKDANADGSGLATLDIWPDLRTSPADEATITVANTVGLFRLASNDMEWELSLPDFHGFTLSITEAL